MCESRQRLASSRVPGLGHEPRTWHRTPSRGQRGPSMSCPPSRLACETGVIIFNPVYRGSMTLSDPSKATQLESDQEDARAYPQVPAHTQATDLSIHLPHLPCLTTPKPAHDLLTAFDPIVCPFSWLLTLSPRFFPTRPTHCGGRGPAAPKNHCSANSYFHV